MERKKKRNAARIKFVQVLPSWEEHVRGVEVLKQHFPPPPFWDGTVDLAQISSFYRAVLRLFKNIVFLGTGEVILVLQNLFREYSPGFGGDQAFYFCSDFDMALLERLVKVFPLEETVGVILARRVEEFKLLTLSFAFPWKKVLLGSTHGIMAEVARELFLPFYPVEDGYHYFWHRSVLLYLPLFCFGVPLEDLDRGFQEGYPLFQKEAMILSLLLAREKEKGWKEVCFLVDNQFLFSLFQSFLPLLEKSCQGVTGVDFGVRDLFSFWDTHRDSPSWREKATSTLFVVIRSGEAKQGLLFQRPHFLQRKLFFEEWNLLDRASFGQFHHAECLALLSVLREAEASFVEIQYLDTGPETVGQIVAFLHQWVCYNAWLRGLDLLGDPPVLGFESLVRSFLKRKNQSMEVRK